MAVLLDSVGGVSFNGNSVGWIRTPYGIRISEDPQNAFRSLRSHINQILSVDGASKDKDIKTSVDAFKSVMKDASVTTGFGDSSSDNLVNGQTTYSAPNYTDTRVGGNDAINPYWQFNRDDDITPPMFEIGGNNKSRRGMGRVYAETYEANQSILWLQMGVPEFTNLVELFTNSGDADAAKAMSQGSLFSLGEKILTYIVKGTLWLIAFPIVAPLWLIKWISTLSSNEITRFYNFRPAMPMYLDMVNSMMAYLAVNLGIYPAYLNGRTNISKSADAARYKFVDPQLEASSGDFTNSSLPEILQNGPDIYQILNRRRANYDASVKGITARNLLMETLSSGAKTLTPAERRRGKALLETQTVHNYDGSAARYGDKKNGPVKRYFSFLKSSVLGAFDFVGFKCEKGVNTTDNLSNQTTPSPLFENLNSKSREQRIQLNQRSILGRIALRGLSGSTLEQIIKGELTRMGLDVLSKTGIGASGDIIASGNGYFDTPEMWAGSSFDRGVNFNIQLRARYGDPVSIYQSIYIPLLMILAAACPRSIGSNMYTSPFMVKAYCKGKFSISNGMITSVSISRGKDSFGWSDDELPTAIDVQITIKDMTPTMFVGMSDIGLFDTFTRNESIMDYLDTLSALGIYERMYTLPRMLRKATAAVLVKKNTIFSPEWWAFKTAKTRAGMAFSALTPWRPMIEKEDYETQTQ